LVLLKDMTTEEWEEFAPGIVERFERHDDLGVMAICVARLDEAMLHCGRPLRQVEPLHTGIATIRELFEQKPRTFADSDVARVLENLRADGTKMFRSAGWDSPFDNETEPARIFALACMMAFTMAVTAAKLNRGDEF
jgi:hypothetical protein